MTSLSLAMILLLCVSVHACTARFPSLTKKDTPHKELDKVKLLETLSASSGMKDYRLQENQQQQANNELNTCESCSISSTSKELIVEASSGTSFQMDSPSFLAAEDERRRERSMLGAGQRHHLEETMLTNGSDSAEDIVEMDYAQPHRKPPIHNEKP
ncbi:hypothetical protein PHAVU_002G062100 [Phaseolus vulgaris]|uniref:Uncharacterized protein n=1 Tax=Phaseolus vulgaris TaxID=3885 RepID=V7CJ66_PHAVU|nr:hypothetical protein PHAVU_002G062100g [Phaseolus vulgaris]ESW29335.1 hypothetical protein PHAVU_002G062100g [Phaseolus vulgaris]